MTPVTAPDPFRTVSSDVLAAFSADGAQGAFRSELSLAPLIAFWTDGTEHCGPAAQAMRDLIRREVEREPALAAPIQDWALLARHQDLLDVMMAAAFPPAFVEEDCAAALAPFRMRSFWATPKFRASLTDGEGNFRARAALEPAAILRLRDAFAYSVVLRKAYGIAVDLALPVIFTTTDPETGLDRYLKAIFDDRFLEVRVEGELPALPDAVRAQPRAALVDAETLRRALPRDRFVLSGFTVIRAFDVTEAEVLSALKRDLIDKESIVTPARFAALQGRMRTLFRRPDLRFGLAALEDDRVLVLNYGARLEHACIFSDSAHHKIEEYADSLYARAVAEGRPLIVRDLAAEAGRTCIDDAVLASGVRSLLLAPLTYQDRVIGVLELGSPTPDDLSAADLPELAEVVPLFAMAVQRSMEEFNTRVQAFIKERFTAIHPVVEWRFRDVVMNHLDRVRAGQATDELEPIVFEGVYPLYGLSDIRGSSTHRAVAIQQDVLTQLALARAVVETAHGVRPLPALHELLHRVERQIARIQSGLQTGDEVQALAFLRGDVETLFAHLGGFAPEVAARIEAYRGALDTRLGTVYEARRRFEDGVTMLNDAVSAYLDLEEQAAQGMFPHYFEKQKTDGVDYQIYVGESLLENGGFHPLYLRNLRLWQLLVTCGIALRVEQVKPRLPMPLEMAHLVLVQHAPLAVRFRQDEKRFDVDGAYNMRYEIVKKRIDKAVVRGTQERLTQPGRIAIVYSHAAEAQEYRDYLDYLQSLGHLEREVEDLELDELQGVSGLRALRATIDLRHDAPDPAATLAAVRAR
jgi:hypothetical protein